MNNVKEMMYDIIFECQKEDFKFEIEISKGTMFVYIEPKDYDLYIHNNERVPCIRISADEKDPFGKYYVRHNKENKLKTLNEIIEMVKRL